MCRSVLSSELSHYLNYLKSEVPLVKCITKGSTIAVKCSAVQGTVHCNVQCSIGHSTVQCPAQFRAQCHAQFHAQCHVQFHARWVYQKPDQQLSGAAGRESGEFQTKVTDQGSASLLCTAELEGKL